MVAETRIVDSHTGGEPTRIVVAGGPELGRGSMAERRERFATEHDGWRRALVNEPRGNDVLVGALLLEPEDPAHDCGVVFFNNAGMLGMCGHGTIGLVQTLRYLGRAQPGLLRIETPVGLVTATLHGDGSVSVQNVPSYRHATRVPLQVPGHGTWHGDVAWGGNWFFLCSDHGLPIALPHVAELGAAAQAAARALQAQGVRGEAGAVIDHVELLGPPHDARHSGRSFVMCPGGAYDRSPCGTGTSAKLACLAAEGSLAPGDTWWQESVVGSVFAGFYEPLPGGRVLPTIRGRAHITLDARVVIDPDDPFAWGMPA